MNPLPHPPRVPVAVEPIRLIVEIDEATQNFKFTFTGAVKIPLVVNALEVIKTQLIHTQLQQAAQQVTRPGKVVLPDGSKPTF